MCPAAGAQALTMSSLMTWYPCLSGPALHCRVPFSPLVLAFLHKHRVQTFRTFWLDCICFRRSSCLVLSSSAIVMRWPYWQGVCSHRFRTAGRRDERWPHRRHGVGVLADLVLSVASGVVHCRPRSTGRGLRGDRVLLDHVQRCEGGAVANGPALAHSPGGKGGALRQAVVAGHTGWPP